MSIFDQFETDSKLEAEGKWFNFPANKDGTIPRVLLARMARTNPRYVSALEHFSKLYKIELENDLLDNAKAEKPMMEVFCSTILLNWEHIQDKQGNEWSYEDRDKLLYKLPAFYDVLRAYARDLAAYRANEVEVNAGN